MPIKLPSHLHRSRSGTLHFRIAIPLDLRHHFGTKEIYRSLHTASVREATGHAQTLSIAFKHVFHGIRQEIMSEQKKLPKRPQSGGNVGLVYEVSFNKLTGISTHKLETQPHDTPEIIDAAITRIHVATSAGTNLSSSSLAQNTQSVSKYVDRYLDSTSADHRPNAKTLESYRAAINTFIKIVGDKPLHALSIQDQNRFDDIIVRLPTNNTKRQETRNLNIDEMLLLGLKPISVQNAKNIARRTNAFLSWAFHREGSKPPFQLLDRVRLSKKRKGPKKRRAFTDEELRLVFNPATLGVSNQPSPYMFWIPLIGLHTGMRINEIAQLSLSDFVMRDEICCFNVTDEPDPDEEAELAAGNKSIKTEASKRLVPIHHRLIDLGLLKYVESLRIGGYAKLFPDLTGGRDGPGQPASKHFARYCDKIGLADKMLVFHSFRHGAVGRMRSAQVLKELRKVVVGHSMLEDTHDGYGDINNDYSILDKQRAINTLRFEGVIDYAALKSKQPTMADLSRAIVRNAKRRDKKILPSVAPLITKQKTSK